METQVSIQAENDSRGPMTENKLVPVFKTDDPALLPLATMALEGEGIEYQVRHAGKSDSYDWLLGQTPTTRPVVVEIVVTSDVAAKARDLLVDLEKSSPSAVPPADPPTVTLEDAGSGLAIGTITEWQLQELTAHLEEEASQTYFVTAETLEMLQDSDVESGVIDMLRPVVASRPDGVSIRWAVR